MNFDLSKSENKESLNGKRQRAQGLIQLHVSGSFIVGFTPLPFSDMPILLANQTALVERILYIYDMNGLKELLNSLISQLGLGFLISRIAASGATYATAQLLKIVPCLGTIGGGLINGTIAGAITYAYGSAVSNFCYHKSLAIIDNKNGECVTKDDVQNFVDVFQVMFRNYGLNEERAD